jgi:UDP-N-acetylmuramoyl-tripeptide--D-alanyl-D-alanine ligase
MLHLLEQQLANMAHYSHFANSVYGICFDIVGMRGITRGKWQWLWLAVAVPVRSVLFAHKQKYYVVEVDADRPKETQYIAKWLKPEVTIWVSLGRSHAVNFEGQVADGEYASVDEAIAHEFAWLARLTKKLVIYDADNQLINAQMDDIKVNKRPINAEILKSYEVWPEHTTFRLTSGSFEILHPVPRNMCLQIGMMVELAEYLRMTPQHDLSSLSMPPGRNNFFEGKDRLRLIDSSYNAHLISMESIIGMFDEMQTSHKWLVISDIIELGESEVEHHERLGEIMAAADVEKYILVGRRTRAYTLPVLERLGKSEKTESFIEMSEAYKYIATHVSGKETILFKGSQYLESIIEKLLASPEDADKLPRRELVAMKRRKVWEEK